MPEIKLRNIKNFICRDINLTIKDKELLVLWGPIGAGKTTLLNVIAGLAGYEGSVLFDGAAVDKLPAGKREVGYFFQDLILFPHLNVRTNIAYSLIVRGTPKKETESKVNELLKLMRIEHLAYRYSKDLSGGEKQKVSLARAVASSPEIMLLDEPLNSLDPTTASYLKMEILRLKRKFGITIIYVTHCFEEAYALADRVAVLNEGKIIYIDSFEKVFKDSSRMREERQYYERELKTVYSSSSDIP